MSLGFTRLEGSSYPDAAVTGAPEPFDVSGLPTVFEFDPGSFVLTAFGRANGGTFRGDRDISDRFLRLFLRI